jgi:DNA-binding response OmpR family regulator
MERKGIASQNHRFGPFEVDLYQCRLTSLGVPVRLQEQPFMVLAVLLEHPGRSDLESLAEETHGRGYELLSRKAAALLDPPAGVDTGPNATRTR